MPKFRKRSRNGLIRQALYTGELIKGVNLIVFKNTIY